MPVDSVSFFVCRRPHRRTSLKLTHWTAALSVFVLTSFAQQGADTASPSQVFGFRDFAQQRQWDQKFIGVPDPSRAEEHLRILTAEPHVAGSPEDKKTADYVAQKFEEAGLQTQIVEYKVWMNRPAEISVTVTAPPNVKMNEPTREHVSNHPYQDDPRVLTPFNGS